jgi:APA family basic amino acid/polyamine antiporter
MVRLKIKEPKLKRVVNLPTLIMYGIGIILGAGIYALIGKAAGMTGNSVWLSFILAAVVSSFTGLSYAELTSIFPKTAAEYLYVKKASKNKTIAFSVGWLEIIADIVAASAVALGFAGYFHALFGVPIVLTAVALVAILSFINFWGIVESTTFNVIFSIIEIVGLLIIVILGFNSIGNVDYMEFSQGIGGTIGAAALIFFAYIGFEDLANISEEAKSSRRNMPKALLISIVVTSLIYMLVSVVAVSVVNWQELAVSTAPLATVASKLIGPQGFLLLSYIALFATANTVLVLLIVGSREIYGISRDGSLPKLLSKVHPKRRTPWVAVLATMVFAIIFILIERIEIVASVTDFGTLATFVFVNIAVIILRFTMPNEKRYFKVPLNIGKVPIIPVLGLFSSAFLIFYLEPITVLIGLAITIGGTLLYVIYRKKF